MTGPSLAVHVTDLKPNRLRFDVATVAGTFTAALENDDVRGYKVSSRGGEGIPGSDRTDGSDGSSGSECGDGGSGGQR